MKKKLLIPGAGNAQIDLIEYAKEKGLEVHGISYTDTDPGIPLLDHFEQINITDTDTIAAYVRKHKIDYIYSVGSDLAIPALFSVAEECGLFHFVSGRTAEICCHKHLMRGAMEGSRYNLPFLCCRSADEAKNVNFYPLMLKPVDSQGQRGVYRVDSFGELTARLADSLSFSKSGQVILEKFVDGDEISVNAYLSDGELLFLLMSDRESHKSFPGGIIKAHHLPSKYEGTDAAPKVRALVLEVTEKLDIRNGPVYFQIKIEKGHPYLIEATPRLDGCHMWRLIKAYCGVDLLEVTLSHLLGTKPSAIACLPSEIPMHTEFFCEAPNTVFDPDKYKPFHADYRQMYYRKGDIVRRMNGYAEKCGYRIFRSPNRAALVGGSSAIGRCLAKMYAGAVEWVDLSRTSGMISEYSYEQLVRALNGCDSAVILAAKKVRAEEKQSLALYEENTRIVENTLMACRTLGIRNVVYLSSRCVYSNRQPAPVCETDLIAPINYYGISKYAGELLCDYYNRYFAFNSKILRLAQVIGAGESVYMADAFVKQALCGKPLTVYGNAQGMRDYIYVKDVCAAIYCALMRYDAVGVYNIGSGIGATSLDLAKAVVSAFESSSVIEMCPDRKEDSSVCYLNTEKARAELGFQCRYDLRSAFADMKKEGKPV